MRVRFWTVSKLPDKCRQPRSIAVIMFTRVLLSNSDILAAHVFGGHRIDPVYRKSIWIGACRYSRRVCCDAPLPASEVLVCYGRAADMMSAPGQKRRFGDVRATSALPPKSDNHRKGRHVSTTEVASDSIASSARTTSVGGIVSRAPFSGGEGAAQEQAVVGETPLAEELP